MAGLFFLFSIVLLFAADYAENKGEWQNKINKVNE